MIYDQDLSLTREYIDPVNSTLFSNNFTCSFFISPLSVSKLVLFPFTILPHYRKKKYILFSYFYHIQLTTYTNQYRWQFSVVVHEAFASQKQMGLREDDLDSLRSLFTDTDPILIGVTLVVSVITRRKFPT